METLLAWISNALSIVTGSSPISIPNRGRKSDSTNPQNIVEENDLLKSRLAQAESHNQEQEARIALLEKQIQELHGEQH